MPVDIARSAPVVERAEIEVRAPVETVWRIISDFSNWPSWNKGVTRMEFPGPLAVGSVFEWVGGGAKIKSKIEEVEELRRLAWSGRTLGIRAYHVWVFTPEGNTTRVLTEESFDGLVAKLFSGYLRKSLSRALHDGLAALKLESESRHRATSAQ